MFRCKRSAIFLAGIILTAAACSSNSVSPSSPATVNSAQRVSNPIQHIVVVMQEARSFDNLFCAYPGVEGKCGSEAIPLEAKCTISDTFQDYERDRKTGEFGKEQADCRGYRRPLGWKW